MNERRRLVRGARLVRSVLGLMLVALGSVARAADVVVNLHAGPLGPHLATYAGATMPDGVEVRIGSLAAGFDTAQNAWDPWAVGQAWISAGKTTTRPLFGEPGRFAISASTSDAALLGARLYVWVLRTRDGGPVADDYSNVVAHALLTGTTAAWRFPSDQSIPPGNITTLALADATSVVVGLRTTGTVQTTRPGVTLPEWAAMEISDPNQRGSLDDPESDGRVNLLEFALGTNPTAAEVSPAVWSSTEVNGKHYLTLTVTRPRDRLDVQVTGEASADLTTWSASGVTTTVTPEEGGVETVVVRDNTATEDELGIDGAGFRFLRLRATELPAP